jgi:hypothetical protein
MTRAADDGGPHWQVATLPAVPGGAIPSTMPLAPPPSPAGTSLLPHPSLPRRPRRSHPFYHAPRSPAVPGGDIHSTRPLAPPPSPAEPSLLPCPSLPRRPRRGHPLAGRPSTAASGGLHDVNDILTA